jgi:hypothetical protein
MDPLERLEEHTKARQEIRNALHAEKDGQIEDKVYDLVPKALDILEELMDTGKADTRFRIARYILDATRQYHEEKASDAEASLEGFMAKYGDLS